MKFAWQAKHRSTRPGSLDLTRGAGLYFGLCLLMTVLLIATLVAVPSPRVSLRATGRGHDIELTSAGTVNGTLAPYQSGELWGGGSQVEKCSACSPTGLLSEAGGESTQPGQDVDLVQGDYTTTDTLFDVPGDDGGLDMSLTYDSGLAISEASALGEYSTLGGYGWLSPMTSFEVQSTNNQNNTVYQSNGATTTFTYDSGGGNCPLGDYTSPAKYTAPSSTESFCSANRTDAQFGYTNSGWLFDESGGKTKYFYNFFGGESAQMNASQTISIIYNYSVTPGTGSCPTNAYNCITATDSAERVVTLVNTMVASNEDFVTKVIDPLGRVYSLNYTADAGGEVLASVTSPAPAASGTVTTSYTYATTLASPYSYELLSATNPDNDTTYVTYTNGMVQDTIPPLGASDETQYSYTLTNCATNVDCVQGTTPQVTTVTYPDGEVDVDTFNQAQLTQAQFGNSATPGSDTNTWDFTYTEPTASNQDGPITEAVSGPNSLTATIATDADGNVTSYTDPNGKVTTSMYNDTGGNDLDELCWSAPPGATLPTSCFPSTHPPGVTSYTYDTYGDELTTTDPMGNTTHMGYYTNQSLCWTAEPTVTATGSPCTTILAGPSAYAPTGATTYSYDSFGNVISTTVAAGTTAAATTTSSYDADDELLFSIPPDGQSLGNNSDTNPYATSYTYFGNGQKSSVVKPFESASETLTTSYTYDNAGNVLTQSDPTGVTSNAYSAAGQVCWTYRSTASASGSCSSPPAYGSGSPPSSGPTITTYVADTDIPATVTDPDGNVTTYTYADKRFPKTATTVQKATVPGNPQANITTYSAIDNFDNTCVSGPVQPSTPENLWGSNGRHLEQL